ncbi:hypothetical protein AMECASPLE_017550 [Ameca splendens]|uniref:Uncharacterized protein n=1 Tax=Ameca splendens TaxID=208324 RepID=A0ABV0XFI4_9TELE
MLLHHGSLRLLVSPVSTMKVSFCHLNKLLNIYFVNLYHRFKGEGGEQQCQAVCCVVEAGWSCLRLLADKLGHHSGLQEVERSQLQALMSHTLLCHPQTQVRQEVKDSVNTLI